jgi:hypothetical protein
MAIGNDIFFVRVIPGRTFASSTAHGLFVGKEIGILKPSPIGPGTISTRPMVLGTRCRKRWFDASDFALNYSNSQVRVSEASERCFSVLAGEVRKTVWFLRHSSNG